MFFNKELLDCVLKEDKFKNMNILLIYYNSVTNEFIIIDNSQKEYYYKDTMGALNISNINNSFYASGTITYIDIIDKYYTRKGILLGESDSVFFALIFYEESNYMCFGYGGISKENVKYKIIKVDHTYKNIDSIKKDYN